MKFWKSLGLFFQVGGFCFFVSVFFWRGGTHEILSFSFNRFLAFLFLFCFPNFVIPCFPPQSLARRPSILMTSTMWRTFLILMTSMMTCMIWMILIAKQEKSLLQKHLLTVVWLALEWLIFSKNNAILQTLEFTFVNGAKIHIWKQKLLPNLGPFSCKNSF